MLAVHVTMVTWGVSAVGEAQCVGMQTTIYVYLGSDREEKEV